MAGSKPNLILQPRDLAFFRVLSEVRLVDRKQAMAFGGFNSQTRANERLLKLNSNGFLRRYFLGTLKGGAKALYTLSAKGAQVAEVENHPIVRAKDSLLVGDPFVNHQLAVNDIHIAARVTTQHDFKFKCFRSFQEPLAKSLPLIPDGYFEVESPSGIKPAFVEVDLGTESLRVWKKKAEMYLQFALGGLFQKIFQHEQFKVLVVASSERRLHSIRKEIRKQTCKIFWFASLETINREGFWNAVWLRPEAGQRHSLIERTL